MAQKSIFKRIWEVICKWLHFGCQKAQESIPIDRQLKMKKQELQEKYNALKNNNNLMRVRGLKEQTDQELNKALKDRRTNNYEQKIRKLMENDNKEEARKLLIRKKSEDENIERLKNKAKICQQQDEKITKSLNILDEQIKEISIKIEELRERNRDAEEQNEIFSLMNELNDINIDNDMSYIKDLVRNNELTAKGREQEFQRRSQSSITNYEIDNSLLDDELENNYK